jgi:hypothetical protein
MIQFSFCAGENCGQATPSSKEQCSHLRGLESKGKENRLTMIPKLSLFGSVCVCESADESWRVRGKGLKEELHSKLLIYTTVYAQSYIIAHPLKLVRSTKTISHVPSSIFFVLRLFVTLQRWYFSTSKEPRNQFQGINFASLCSLAGWYDNLIPTRFLAHIDRSKIPAHYDEEAASWN